ncbi:MAG: hypothetical protein K8R53_09370, partial [Bacteroidales bacterium]|nr:hypothetical protein [Bacteroidales bacterium]
AGCVQCHDNSQVIFAKTIQWEASTHATGGNFERNGTDCAPCHTSQGFLEVMAAGTQATTADISNPNPPNCYTCHKIHETYSPDDWAITYMDPVTLWHPTTKAEVDLGTGNLCANCHQSRIPDPFPVPGGGNVSIGSPYWGAHHGPVANIIAGAGGYEVAGSLPYTPASFHSTNVENSCTTCHLASAYGVQAGGHNMGMTYAYHGNDVVNTAGCVECHSDVSALETKIEDTKDEISGLMDQLFGLLTTQGVMDSTNHAIPMEMTVDQAGGIINYNMSREDKSFGIHNYNYVKALLTNSVESLAD